MMLLESITEGTHERWYMSDIWSIPQQIDQYRIKQFSSIYSWRCFFVANSNCFFLLWCAKDITDQFKTAWCCWVLSQSPMRHSSGTANRALHYKPLRCGFESGLCLPLLDGSRCCWNPATTCPQCWGWTTRLQKYSANKAMISWNNNFSNWYEDSDIRWKFCDSITQHLPHVINIIVT